MACGLRTLDDDGRGARMVTLALGACRGRQTGRAFEPGAAAALPRDCLARGERAQLIVWEISAVADCSDDWAPQTLLCAEADGDGLPNLWLGISGGARRLTALLSPEAGRSPHRWTGPKLPIGERFRLQFAIHSGMGPGGLLWRWGDDQPWSSLTAASPWGAERLPWSRRWKIGRGLSVTWHRQVIEMSGI